MLKIAVCDEEPDVIRQVKACVSKTFEDSSLPYFLEGFLSGEDLLAKLTRGVVFDIIYLGIGLKGLSGIEVGRRIREQFHDSRTLFIFIASSEEKAKELFECNTFRLLLKPIDQSTFIGYLKSACDYLGIREQEFLEFKEIKGDRETVPFGDILYLESAGRIIRLVTNRRRYCFYGKLGEIARCFQNADFIRIHNSILVNYDYILSIRYDSVSLLNGETKDISGPKRKAVRETYTAIRQKREERCKRSMNGKHL